MGRSLTWRNVRAPDARALGSGSGHLIVPDVPSKGQRSGAVDPSAPLWTAEMLQEVGREGEGLISNPSVLVRSCHFGLQTPHVVSPIHFLSPFPW